MSGQNSLAEREGFEPPIPFQVWPLSRRLVSTTHAPLRIVKTTQPRTQPLAHRSALQKPINRSKPLRPGSATLSEERLEEIGAFGRQHSGGDLHAMVERGVVQYGHDRGDGTGFWV